MLIAGALRIKECSFLDISIYYEFGFRNENVLWVKVGHFKKSCHTNCDKKCCILRISKMGQPACAVKHFVNILTVLTV